MGDSRHPRVSTIASIAMLVAVAAVVWLPALSPLGTAQSPLPTPDGSAARTMSPAARAGWTVLFVALGAAAGLVIIVVYRAWLRRERR
jgi:hypothetical protein